MDIFEAQLTIHKTAVEHGWYDGPADNVPTKLALIHSEVSEALEEYRNVVPTVPDDEELIVVETDDGVEVPALYWKDGKPEGFGIELADVIIRVLDLSEHLGMDMDYLVNLKMVYNESRPYRHGGKRV